MAPITDPVEALDRVVYYLDRELAPSPKVRAFRRARDIIVGLDAAELDELVRSGRLTELEGIGPATGAVISDAVTGTESSYVSELEERTRIPLGDGAELRKLIKGDCHMHSTWSDGGASIEAMARAAQELGHEYIVMTDHSPRLTIAHGLSEERLRAQIDEIAELNVDLAPFRVLTGMEVDINGDGSLDMSDEVLAELDLVVASVHSQLGQDPALMTRRMVMAIANPHVDVLGHCTGRKVKPNDQSTKRAGASFDADMIFAACARFDTAVEINCRPERQDPPGELLDLALEWETKISIDTDAHAPGHLEFLNYGCDKAIAHGVDPADVINTWGADDLLAWAADHPSG